MGECDAGVNVRRFSAAVGRPDVAAGALLLVVYGASLARGVTYWDAGEFLAAIHSLGIPHPPGTPLFILAARVWSMLAAPALGFTVAVNAFSALCTAAAFAIVANLFWRWTRDALASFAAAFLGGVMSTVWLNATETEVYACSLCLALIIVWTADRYRATIQSRWILLALYLCGLGWALHLTALLAVPAALALVLAAPSRPRLRDVVPGLALAALGASVVLFMLVRARHDPAINQANPSTFSALVDAVQRRQYDVAPLWPRRAPLWLQFGNVFEYADWQFALGLTPGPAPAPPRTIITVLYALLGAYGCLRHRAISRATWRVWMTFFVTASVGVVLYLNMRAGASYGWGVLPATAIHEARDRDYFFTWAFLCWGAWAGFGAVMLARRLGDARASVRAPALALSVGLAVAPAALNWTVVRAERRDAQRAAERGAAAMLRDLPPRAVFLALGDNDTYLLWYLQQVRGMRRDVTVVTIPLLTTAWNRAELKRRYGLLDSLEAADWYGTRVTLQDVRARAAALGRPVVESPYLRGPPLIH